MLVYFKANRSTILILPNSILHQLIRKLKDHSIRFPSHCVPRINDHLQPFNPVTNIKYLVPQISHVKLKVYDLVGGEIETLVNKEKTTGTYILKWHAADLASGVYFYQLKAVAFSTGSGQVFIQTKKMLLLK